MKNVLVSGGAGFLGSHLCERLIRDGCSVVSLDSLETGLARNLSALADEPGFRSVQHDVAEPLPDDLSVDAIYHLACPASPPQYQRDPVRTILTNVMGTHRMLELAQRCRARLLIASTSEVYGDPLEHPQRESYWGNVNPIGERACYDEGKRCAEALVVSWARTRGVECRIARVFNTYGPRMREDDGRVVSNFVAQALRGEPLTIYGDGRQTRSFCYVSDLIEGLVRLMATASDPGPVNLGNPSEIEVGELADMVLAMTGHRSRVVHHPLPSDDPTRRRPDIGRARAILDWRPVVDLATGLAHTIDDFRTRIEHEAATPPARALA